MLLLKKKKYAAVKLEPGGPDGQMVEVGVPGIRGYMKGVDVHT